MHSLGGQELMDHQSDAGSSAAIHDVFERFPQGLMVCERDGRIVTANRSVREIVERSAVPGGLTGGTVGPLTTRA
jgi:PAS domain-containing protein